MRSFNHAWVAALALVSGACVFPAPSQPASSDGGSVSDAGVSSSRWTWVPVDGSQCASGSRAGFAINPQEGAKELFVFLQGGGACWNQGTCVPSLLSFGPLCDYGGLCLVDSAGGTRPTSSWVTHPDPFPADGGGALQDELASITSSLVFDRSAPGNPFRNATFVFVPYCTGDLHAGASERTYQYKYQLLDAPAFYTIHHAGAANMAAYLTRLAALVPNVERVWLTGASAGGYGATLNLPRVQSAFPLAEVHLLADSAPFIDAAAHWPEWREAWNLQMPAGCSDCDAGFSKVIEHLASSYPGSRIGLLATQQDRVISWFFLAGTGLGAFLSPPMGAYSAALEEQLGVYDSHSNTRYFVAPGDGHVLWGGYGQRLPDGGMTNSLASADAGTLHDWINSWATGGSGFASTRP